MPFNPNLQIGQEISNSELVSIFKCGNMGGMRRSHTTNTLVLVSDYTKGLYHDKWIGGTLHYTGMGKNGDQDLHWAQNDTLAGCGSNGVDIHLFEVMTEGCTPTAAALSSWTSRTRRLSPGRMVTIAWYGCSPSGRSRRTMYRSLRHLSL